MTSKDAFLRDLELWLDEVAGPAAPDYLDDVVAAVDTTGQQPAWSSLERWLPIDTTSVGRRAQLRRLAWVAVVGAVLAALVAAVAFIGAPRKLPPPFGLAWNGQIAIANPDSIVVAGPDGSNPRLLVAVDGVESLTWSPDGTRLAFWTLGPESGEPTVVVVNADATGLTDVARDVAPIERYAEPIGWSPDSTRVIVASPAVFETAIAILNADGSGSRLLFGDARTPGLDRTSVAWSPNGQWISFIGTSRTTNEVGLYVVHPDGTGQLRVADVTATNGLGIPSWAPDPSLSRLLFVDADRGIALVDVATGRVKRLSHGRAIWPTWSPDGQSIAWWSDGIFVGETDGLLSGSPARLLMAGPSFCTDPRPTDPGIPCGPPVWSPDGRRLFAPSGPGTSVVAVSVDGSAEAIVIPLKPGAELNPTGSAAWQRAAAP